MTPKTLMTTLARVLGEHQKWARGETPLPPPPIYLMGSPGTGKTSMSREAGARAGFTTLLVDPITRDVLDIAGLCDVDRSDPQRIRTQRAVPDLVTELEKIEGPKLLLLDDFPAATRIQQASFACALLERQMGGHPLPKDCYVMATGNLGTDKVVFHDIPSNVWNRWVWLKFDASVDDWCDWAIGQGFDSRLVAAVREDGWRYDAGDQGGQKWVNLRDPQTACCTPRALARANQILGWEMGEHETQELLCGAVGNGPGMQLWARIQMIEDLPTVEEVVRTPQKAKVPKEAGSQYTIARSLFTQAHLRGETFGPILEYVQRLGPEFVVFGLQFRLDLEQRDKGLPRFAQMQNKERRRVWEEFNGTPEGARILEQLMGRG